MPISAFIPSPWRLRNDGDYLVVYECQASESRHRVLSPLEAILAPFLDGTMTSVEIQTVWSSVLDSRGDKDQIDPKLCDLLLEKLKESGILSDSGILSPSFNQDRLSFVPNFSNYTMPGHRLARPLSVLVALTDYCRTDCIYCYAERKNTIHDELGFEEWVVIFDELRDNEVYIVDISGGDLLARKDALRLLTAMVERDFVFFLSTKCPIDPSTASRLRELGIGNEQAAPHLKRKIQISVDSDDPEIAGRLVGRPGHLERTKQSVVNCVAAGVAPRIKGVLTSLNANAAEGVVECFERLGVRDFQFSQYSRTHYRHDDNLFLSLEQKMRLGEQAARIRDKYPHITFAIQDDVTIAANPDWNHWNKRALCSAGRMSMIIKPNGDVTLCDQIPQEPEYIVANVKSSGVMAAWRSPGIGEFLSTSREKFAGTSCYSCEDFEVCHSISGKGYCFRDSLFAFGTVLDAPPNCPRQDRVGLRQA